MDWTFQNTMAVFAVVAFNAPIVVTAWKFRSGRRHPPKDRAVPPQPVAPAAPLAPQAPAVSSMLQEKDANGAPTGAVSFSRVTGLIGATVVASLFWIVSNIVVATAIVDPQSVSGILTNMTKLFLIGAALFVPYAFNQLKTLLQ